MEVTVDMRPYGPTTTLRFRPLATADAVPSWATLCVAGEPAAGPLALTPTIFARPVARMSISFALGC